MQSTYKSLFRQMNLLRLSSEISRLCSHSCYWVVLERTTTLRPHWEFLSSQRNTTVIAMVRCQVCSAQGRYSCKKNMLTQHILAGVHRLEKSSLVSALASASLKFPPPRSHSHTFNSPLSQVYFFWVSFLKPSLDFSPSPAKKKTPKN